MKLVYNVGSNTRLYILSIMAGLFAGIFATAFRWGLKETELLRIFMFQHDKSLYFHLSVIAGMWIVLILVNWLKNHVQYIGGSGIPQSRAVIFGLYDFKRPVIQFVSKFFGSLSTIGIGLSLGREGPSVQIGTFGASIISRIFRSNPTEKRYLATAGAGAGLSAAFTAPIASTIFIIEDTLGWVSLKVTLPVLIACLISGYCVQVFLPENIYATLVPISPDVTFFWLLVMMMGLAILATLGGKLFNILLFSFKGLYMKSRMPEWIKLLAIVLLTYVIGMFIIDLTAGGEDELVNQILYDGGNVWWLFALVVIKLLFTAACYSAGLCGSLLLPLIVMGGLLGKAYALLLVQLGVVEAASCSYFTLIGMSVLFISVVRAPISGMMLILEMTTQYTIFFPMIFAATLTFLFGQYFNIKPVYHTLYNDMLSGDKSQFTEVEFQINNESVLDGMQADKVALPQNCSIVGVKRSFPEISDIPIDSQLAKGDIIKIKIPSDKYSELFKVFRALANE